MKLGIYRHYKGKLYKALAICLHSETKEELVLYETLYENPLGNLWVRPKVMFLEKVEVEGKMVERFKYIGDKKGNTQI